MPRFFVASDAVNGDKISVFGDDARHIALSLRMRTGDAVTLCDGEGHEYSCALSAVNPTEVTANIEGTSDSLSEPPYKARVFQALPKGEKADTIVQKSVECGAHEIVFFPSEHCIAKLESRNANKKLERWQKIAEEAAKQCGRGIIPRVRYADSFKNAVADAAKADLALFCYEECGKLKSDSIGKILDNSLCDKINTDISFMIGSEGGFSPAEANYAVDNNLVLIGLGRRILRCETVAPFMLACLSMKLELS